MPTWPRKPMADFMVGGILRGHACRKPQLALEGDPNNLPEELVGNAKRLVGAAKPQNIGLQNLAELYDNSPVKLNRDCCPWAYNQP